MDFLNIHPLIAIIVGVILTIILNSSTVVIGIAITLALQNLIGLESGIAIVIGAGAGTSFTAVLASAGFNKTARKSALANMFFSFSGIVLFTPFIWLFAKLYRQLNIPVPLALAYSQLFFSLTRGLIFLPFTKKIANYLEKR